MSDDDIRYTVNISKHATLKDMTVDGVGTLDFDRDTNTGYHYYVDSTQDGVDITATAYKNSYTITIDGNTATGGEVYRLAYDWDENGKMEVPLRLLARMWNRTPTRWFWKSSPAMIRPI